MEPSKCRLKPGVKVAYTSRLSTWVYIYLLTHWFLKILKNWFWYITMVLKNMKPSRKLGREPLVLSWKSMGFKKRFFEISQTSDSLISNSFQRTRVTHSLILRYWKNWNWLFLRNWKNLPTPVKRFRFLVHFHHQRVIQGLCKIRAIWDLTIKWQHVFRTYLNSVKN